MQELISSSKSFVKSCLLVLKKIRLTYVFFRKQFSSPSSYGCGEINFSGDGVISTRPYVDLGDDFLRAFSESMNYKVPERLHKYSYISHRAQLYYFGASIAALNHPGLPMVECGVWYGFLARTTLKLFKQRGVDVAFHLIDLFGQDINYFKGKGKYSEYSDTAILDAVIERFQDMNAIIHQGLVPEVFNRPDIQSLTKISFLSSDLNGAQAEKDTLEYFFPKLAVGGIVYADDYGCQGYEKSREVFDDMILDKCIPLKSLHSPALFMKIRD